MHLNPVPARDPSEAHRAATMLELFYDLVAVVAIAAAATGLHHMISHGDVLEGVIKFAVSFSGIWMAWANYTWYASAFDSDDTAHRIGTMVIMVGALTLAAGIPDFFEHASFLLTVSGFIIMRLGLAFLWWRVIATDGHEWRGTAMRYGGGLVVLQVCWVIGIFGMEQPFLYPALALIFLGEMLLPVYAEAKKPTPFHRHHMVERYGLLNIIVLGESLLSVSFAIQLAYHDGHMNWPIVGLACSGMVIVCAVWWLYYSANFDIASMTRGRSLFWVYGHYFILASGAAIGAGLAVMVELLEHKAHISMEVGLAAVAFPSALFVLGIWLIHERYENSGLAKAVLPISAVALLVAPFFQMGIYPIAVILVATVFASTFAKRLVLQEQ